MQKRLAQGTDAFLQKTQYGFRAERGTEDAIHLIRRIAEFGEQTINTSIMVFLDWENI